MKLGIGSEMPIFITQYFSINTDISYISELFIKKL